MNNNPDQPEENRKSKSSSISKVKQEYKDYYKNPRSDISSLVGHLVRAEKEKYDLERKNAEHQSSIFKLVNLLDKSTEKQDQYKTNYKHVSHKLDYLVLMSKIMKNGIINSIQKDISKYELKDSCSICLEQLDKENETIMVTTCSHLFHKDCILRSLESIHNKCPNCRTQILLGEAFYMDSNKNQIPSKNKKLYTVLNHCFEAVDFNYFAEEEFDDEDISDEEDDASDASSIPDEDEEEEDEEESFV